LGRLLPRVPAKWLEQRLEVEMLQEQGRRLRVVLKQGLEQAPLQRQEQALFRVLGSSSSSAAGSAARWPVNGIVSVCVTEAVADIVTRAVSVSVTGTVTETVSEQVTRPVMAGVAEVVTAAVSD
jgi:hypothetical protein